VLFDVSTGDVVAASSFSDATFRDSSSAVRFADGAATLVLDVRRWSPDLRLALRVEAVQRRTRFLLREAGAGVAAVILLVLGAVALSLRIAKNNQQAARLHLAGSLLFIAIAVGTFASAYPGAPVRVDESTDEAALNSFAAARDDPSHFANRSSSWRRCSTLSSFSFVGGN
jgi:Zn-dependent protease